MRSLTIFAMLGTAAALAACSSGGGGGLDPTPLDLGFEPGGNTYEAPPNKGASLAAQAGAGDKTSAGSSKPTTDAGPTSTPTPGKTDPPVSKTDASVPTGGTCADLEACCAEVPAAQKQTCDTALKAAADNDTACGSYVTAFKNAGYCP